MQHTKSRRHELIGIFHDFLIQKTSVKSKNIKQWKLITSSKLIDLASTSSQLTARDVTRRANRRRDIFDELRVMEYETVTF